jgi:hypothetical protein
VPTVYFPDDELLALYAAFTPATSPRIDWDAYDRGRQRIIDAGRDALTVEMADQRVRELDAGGRP